MHSFAIRVRAEKQKQKQKEGIKPSEAALKAARKKLQHQQGVNKKKANGVKKPASNKPASNKPTSNKPACPPNKQAKKKKTALPEITYHVATTRPAWADEPGERYGAYHRFLQEQKQKEKIKAEQKEKVKPMKDNRSKALSAHRRWLKKNNKVQDVSQEANNVSDNKEKDQPKQSSGAAIVLYVGLGLIVIGLIMTIVGIGENGFRTIELQLVGPSLLGMGVFFCLLRILTCTFADFFARMCPCCCKSSNLEKEHTISETPAKTESQVGTPKKDEIENITNDQAALVPTHASSSSKPITVQASNDVVSFVNEATTAATVGKTEPSGRVVLESKKTSSELDEWYNEFEEVELNNPTRSQNRKNELMLNPNKLIS